MRPFNSKDFLLKNLAHCIGMRQARILSPAALKNNPYKKRNIIQAVRGEIDIGNLPVSISIGTDYRFPQSLPVCFLHPWDALGFIPHVNEEEGFICYADEDGLVLDSNQPEGILEWAAKRAIVLLQDQSAFTEKGEIPPDFMDEFHAYWRQSIIEDAKTIHSHLLIDDKIRKICAFKGNNGFEIVADSRNSVVSYFNGDESTLDKLTRSQALFIPLNESTRLLPPLPNQPWSLERCRQIIETNLSGENIRKLNNLCHKFKDEELVVISIPRISGGYTLIGLLFQNIVGGHPLTNNLSSAKLTQLEIQRLDPSYLIHRGGGYFDIRKTRTLLVGCGAIGGYVAHIVAQMGIRKLTIVDPDIMKFENTFRHILGSSSIGRHKVYGLKTEIERKYPYALIDPHPFCIQDALKKRIKLSNFDLVVFATGNITTELHMNKLLRREKTGPLAVYTWLEPYGIGGHSLLTRSRQHGCYHCLYTSVSEPNTGMYNRASFSAPGQFFGKDDLGCGSNYAPFSTIDAMRTAEMAVRLAIDGLRGVEQGCPIISWKGQSDDFIAAGFKISDRYSFSLNDLEKQKYAYISRRCSICNTLM